MLYEAAILCWVCTTVPISVDCTHFLQHYQILALHMGLQVVTQISIRHCYTPSTDNLKDPKLTSGFYERVYTHTVFQHCEPWLTSCCQTHAVMSVKPVFHFRLGHITAYTIVIISMNLMEFILASKQNYTPIFFIICFIWLLLAWKSRNNC